MGENGSYTYYSRRDFIGSGFVAGGAAVGGLALMRQIPETTENSITLEHLPATYPFYQTITAQVEECGWILSIITSALLGGFDNYSLDPDGSPRMILRSSHVGFVKSANNVASGLIVRNTIVTAPLRKPVNPKIRIGSSPNSAPAKIVDETDLGSGFIQIRLALSETIYESDADLILTALQGWRFNAPEIKNLTVTNKSKVVAPIPIFRWVLAPYDKTFGTFRLSIIVASHHPVGFDPVAGVRFTITDGVITKEIWSTALSNDDTFGDNLRCHSVLVDPSTAGALSEGLLRCDAEIYPYLGVMRSTDRLGTRSMAGLNVAAYSTNAESPWVIGYDPTGMRYSSQFAYLDPINGSVVASTNMIANSRASAKAVPPTSRPRDLTTAIQAARLMGRVLPAANGGIDANNAIDGLVITLAPGVHANAFGNTSVSIAVSCSEIPIVLEGDPDHTDARSVCVMQTAQSATTRVPRIRYRRMTIEAGGSALSNSGIYNFIDDVEIRGKAGSEYSETAPISASKAPVGHWSVCATKSRIWRTGWRLSGGASGPGLIRASENSRQAEGFCMVKNRWISKSEDGYTFDNTTEGYGMWFTTKEIAGLEDVFCSYNDLRSLVWQGWRPRAASASISGTRNPSLRRHVISTNIFERVTELSTPFFSYGEGALVTMSSIIIEGNTFVGSGFNAFYSDPRPSNIKESNTLYNEAFLIRMANNATDRNASKQDDFNDPDTRTARGGPPAHGYRPHMVHAWGPHFGAGLEGNYDASRAGTIANYRREFPGLRSVQEIVPTNPGWLDDRSLDGTKVGGGIYVPIDGAKVLGRVIRGNSDQDWAGRPIAAYGAAGALQPSTVAV